MPPVPGGDRLLIEGLENQVTSSDEDIELLRTGSPWRRRCASRTPRRSAADLTQRLEAFEEARREIRLSVTSALRDEGLSAAEIGELFGVTRQLARRFAREAQDSPTSRATPGSEAAPTRGILETSCPRGARHSWDRKRPAGTDPTPEASTTPVPVWRRGSGIVKGEPRRRRVQWELERSC